MPFIYSVKCRQTGQTNGTPNTGAGHQERRIQRPCHGAKIPEEPYDK